MKTMTIRHMADAPSERRRRSLKALVGSGDKIMLFLLPFLVIAVGLGYLYPSASAVPEMSLAVRAFVWAALAIGVTMWLWSVALILAKVPKGELITSGPFALVKHPLYTAVSLLVIPAVGLLLGSWLGLVIGVPMYVGARRYAPAEEKDLARTFGAEWYGYCERVKIPWL